MFLHSTVLLCSTVLMLPLTAVATPTPTTPAPSLVKGPDLRKTFMVRNLDTEMGRSGKIAEPALRSKGERIVSAAAASPRPETKVDTVSAASPQTPATWLVVRDDPTLTVQYGEAFSATVGECRFKVAHELGVSPLDVEAGVVTFRWTIEPSGRFRDASMIAASPTNEALMACAQKLVVGQVLLNAVTTPLALEWTYAFRTLGPMAPMAETP